ncbi:hypothetical protein [Hoylesella shahii]|nr:hypothetical protein [Hoylesella shahii]
MLLIIDPNNDFADSHGSLYVPNANKAIEPSRIISTRTTPRPSPFR